MYSLRSDRLREADVLVIASLLWFMILFMRYALPPLFETFQIEYGVSNSELGLAFSAMMVAYGLMQFPSGWLADKIGMVEVIVGGAALYSTAALVISMSPNQNRLVVGVVLIGVGTGAHKTVTIPLLSKLYPDSTGRMLGLMDTIGQFGGVLAPAVVLAVLSAQMGWRTIFLVSAGVCVTLGATFFVRGNRRLARKRTQGSDPETSEGLNVDPESGAENEGDDSYRQALFRPRFVLFVLVTILIAFAHNGIVAFLPLYLVDSTGLSSAEAGLMFSVYFAISVTQPVVGEAGDRLGKLVVMTGAAIAAGLGMAGILTATGVIQTGASVLLLGIGMHGFRPVRDAYLTDIIPAAVGGGTLGIARSLMILFGSVAPAFVGVIADFFDFWVAFLILAANVAGSILLIGALWVSSAD